ncbi:MAG: hypothetical protein PWP57_639 [Candidatus Atribacteria bacterium]|nr:hypothetical protein [Candidatus Atribacteria bacterium]
MLMTEKTSAFNIEIFVHLPTFLPAVFTFYVFIFLEDNGKISSRLVWIPRKDIQK